VTAPTKRVGAAEVDVERLLVAVDRRLRARRVIGLSARAGDVDSERPPLDVATVLAGAELRAYSAPYFNLRGAGPMQSVVKRVLNLPLRLFGRPQQYANQAVTHALESSARALEAVLAAQGALLDLLGMQEDRLERLAATLGHGADDDGRLARRSVSPPAADGPLRIGLVSRTYPPRADVGGVARYTHELAHALHALGHEVHVITEGRGDERRDAERLVVHGTMPDLLPLVGGCPMADRILRWAVAVNVRIEALERTGVALDVVESHNWESESIGVVRAGRTPVVVRIATPHVVVAREAGWPASADLGKAIALERWLIDHADGISHSTCAIRDTIESEMDLHVADDRRVLIPFGMALPSDSAARAGGPARLLFVGRLESRKGIDTLLAIVPALLKRYPQLVVDIVGKDVASPASPLSARQRFEGAHEVAPWRSRCRFHGAVDDRRLDAFYRDCTVFVAPSRYESFGLIYLEAMRWGKPVVGCRAGGIPEVVRDGETGLLVPPGDEAALQAAVVRLLDDADLRVRLGARAREAMQSEFSPSLMAERTVAFYRRTIARAASDAR
jgi:glycosyltransferase involved in cell wall biosynthesis